MPADSYSSDDSDGGVRLHPSLVTPVAPPQPHHEGTKSDSPSDEEKALVRASANFGSLKDPFAETPGVPQSIPPNAYSRRSAFPQPTPSRANTGFNRFGNTQPVARYRSSTTAVTSNSVPRFRSGMNGAAFNNGNLFADEPDLHSCQQVFASIMTATQYVNVSPGMSSQTQMQLTHLLQEISQGFSTATVQLRQQRDDANRGKEDEHERYKRAMHEADELRKTHETVQSLNKTLMPQLSHLVEREKLLKDHIKDLKQQLRLTQKQLEKLTTDAMRFHAHHDKVIEDYKEQDEKHFKAMTQLENEVKALRCNTTASNAGDFSSPTQPASVNNVTDGKCNSDSPKPKKKLTGHDAALLLDGLHKVVEQACDHDQKPKKDNFIPNPEAPAWAPIERTQASANAKASSEVSTEQQEGSTSGNSGNSGEVILYTGHGNQTRAVTPYMGPPANGGAPTYIRTPFGIVFGEYPTVEENSRLPGDKMIPRDKVEWDVVDVQRAMAHLYDLCKGYVANCHMHNQPNVAFSKLKEQESYTWHYLMQQVYKDPEHASNHLAYLLSTKVFVPYLIQRTCVDYLLKKLLTPQVFLGFSDQMDAHLRALQGQLANIADTRDRPTHNRSRQRVIEDHAKLIRAIAMSKEVSEFRRRTVDRHASIISALLDPCRSQGTSVDTAQKSLRIMVAACWDISIKVWSSGKTLHYVFPECANKFSPGTMEALNGHHMATSPEELVNSQCRVSLVVTPTMTLRDDRDAARMQCFAIHKAQVLVMK
ncbi:hypothetical protein E0Z10_g8319 [Xylaria hypoxylon]|uniref:Uncharacterized protein n=1 Tax=Xylaria hypoxylon TaxID=37992 RepID=A0A4Z0Y8G1_9PEZI|nr:hypothetical protein E0Z10_g8319 [Xylaria hypoxylon]